VQTAEARRKKRATPQGGAISPLLANCYFRRFLLAWHDHGHLDKLDAHVVNYGDDFVICCRPGHAPAMARMATLTRLALEVNAQKTRIARLRDESFDFLGYRVGRFHRNEAPVYRRSAMAEGSKEPVRTHPPTDHAPVYADDPIARLRGSAACYAAGAANLTRGRGHHDLRPHPQLRRATNPSLVATASSWLSFRFTGAAACDGKNGRHSGWFAAANRTSDEQQSRPKRST
jgi:hypothetical protein